MKLLRRIAEGRRLEGPSSVLFLSPVVVLDVHFPGGVLVVKLLDEVLREGLVAVDGDECVAEEVEPSSSVIALDDSGCVMVYLSYLMGARGSMMNLSWLSSKSRGSCPI